LTWSFTFGLIAFVKGMRAFCRQRRRDNRDLSAVR
jgi:hypothetical protein